jgi:hypothetical protein
MGYSPKINDLAFSNYLNNIKKWSIIFASILASVAIVSFYIYGETSSEMGNPESLYIGLGIASMFILIAVFQIISRNRSVTWDGSVIDKKQVLKKRKMKYDNTNSWKEYMEFTVFIRRDNGDMHRITADDDDTLYNYYTIGDKVKHHKRLNSYEKYDKSKDTIAFCNACASLNDIHDDYCFRCKCPLLK